MRPGRRPIVPLVVGLFLLLCGAGFVALLSDSTSEEASQAAVDETAPPEGGNQVEIRLRDREKPIAKTAPAVRTPAKTSKTGRSKPKTKPKPKAPTGPPGTFVGVVEDRDGLPIAGATVKLRGMRRGRRSHAATTDPIGRFSLELPPGRYMVWAEAKGYANSETDWDLRIRSEEESTSKLVVRPANALRGQVLSDVGRPIRKAEVETWAGRRRRKTVRTDVEGRFVLEDLPEGVYTVRVSADGYVTSTQREVPLSARKGGELVVRLASSGRLAGVVRDDAGAALPRALVFAYRGADRLGMTETDAEGRYALTGVQPGKMSLFARSRDYTKTTRVEAEVAAGQLRAVDLIVTEAAQLTGVLTDSQGKPLARYTVRARESTGEIRRRAQSDAEGRYTIKNLYPGRYALVVTRRRSDAAALAEAEVVIVAGAVTRDFTVQTGGGIAGTVTGPKGEPLKRAGVYAIVGKAYRGQTRTDDQGRFRLVGLPADEYQLFVRVDRPKLVALKMVTVTEGSTFDLSIQARPPAQYTGRLLDPAGEPVVNVLLRVRAVGAPVERSARTDAEGRFQIGPLYDGQYRFEGDAGSLKLVAHNRDGVKAARIASFTFEIREGRSLIRDLRLVLDR